MKRRIMLFSLLLLAATATYAKPYTRWQDGKLLIKVESNNDFTASDFTAEELKAKKVKLTTAKGVKLSVADFKAFFGNDYSQPTFSKITDLDLSSAELQNDNVIKTLGYNSRFLNDGKQLGTLILPECIHSTTFSFDDNRSKWTEIIFPNATKVENEATTIIEANTFSGDTYLQRLVIGTSTKKISSMAFNGCTNLAEVEYLYGLKKVSPHSFYGCIGLKILILPESLETIGKNAFENCSNLTTLRLPNSLKTISEAAFYGTSITSVVIPASVENIANNAFGNIQPLKDVYVLGTETKCANQAFQPTSYTYGYRYSGQGNGETVSLSDFSTARPGIYTVLHYPKEAYEKYVNKYIRVIGTDQYASSEYSPWDNKWVRDAAGNKYPVQDFGYFDGKGGDYAGWWNFMLTGQIKSVHREERIVDGKWYSVCYPFALTAEQIHAAFGNGAEVCEFSSVTIANDPHITGGKYITLNFTTEVTSMKAHHPYMIHPAIHKAGYTTIVDINTEKDTDNDNFVKKLKDEAVSYTTDGVVYTFIGNYKEGEKIPKYSYYYYSGNNISWPNAFYKALRTDAVFTPRTAIVQLNRDNGASGHSAKQNYFERVFKDLDNTTTGIDELLPNLSIQKGEDFRVVYNINGQIVRVGSTSLQGLPGGAYIINGKKVIK